MKKNLVEGIIFLLSLTCLVITVQQFISLGVFVDEFGLSPDVVLGGNFWLLMDWLKLFLLMGLTALTGIRFLSGKEK